MFVIEDDEKNRFIIVSNLTSINIKYQGLVGLDKYAIVGKSGDIDILSIFGFTKHEAEFAYNFIKNNLTIEKHYLKSEFYSMVKSSIA